MALSERIPDTKPSPMRKTVIHVAGFGLGSLLVCVLLSWLAIQLAEKALPMPAGASAGGRDAAKPTIGGAGLSPVVKSPPKSRDLSKTPGSKAAPGRGNDSPSDAGD